MVLANTNKQRNSKSTIEAVMRLKQENFDKFTAIIEEMGAITDKIFQIHIETFSADLFPLIDRN